MLAIGVTLSLALVAKITITRFKKDRSVSRLSLVPQYWSLAQNIILIIFMLSYLWVDIDPQVLSVWKATVWQISAICVEGTLLTLAVTLDLITALVQF